MPQISLLIMPLTTSPFAVAIQAAAQDAVGPNPADTAPLADVPAYIAIGVALALAAVSLLFDLISFRASTNSDEIPGVSTTESRMVIRSGGGCLLVFGAVFAAAGIFAILVGFEETAISTGFRIATSLMGVPFFVFGAGLVVARKLTILDRRSRTLAETYSIFSLPVRKKERQLERARYLRLQRRIGTGIRRSSDNQGSNRKPSFPVTLCFSQGEDTELFHCADVFASRTYAEHFARFLRLPIHDETEKAHQIRQHDELDTPLASAAIADEGSPPVPQEPVGCRIRTTVSGPKVVLVFPPVPTYRPRLRISHLLVPVLIGSTLSTFFHLDDPSLVIGISFAAVLPLFYLLSYVAYRMRKKHFEVITITPDALQLQQCKTFRNPKYELPAADIEELVVNTQDFSEDREVFATIEGMIENGVVRKFFGIFTKKLEAYAANQFHNRPALLARGDHGILRFGQGLTHEEAYYARSLILNALRR